MNTHPKSRTVFRALTAAFTVAVLLVLAPAPAGAQAAGLEIEIDFVSSTFDVTEGADVLGCSSGSFTHQAGVDDETELVLVTFETTYLLERVRVMTCESGTRNGTFSVRLGLGSGLREIAAGTGRWSVTGPTGDFAGLSGAGDFSVGFNSPSAATETFAGTIDHAPTPEELAFTGTRTLVAAAVGAVAMAVGTTLRLVARSL